MPIFTDNHKELEDALIPMILEGIITPYFTVHRKAGSDEYRVTPREYPNVTVHSSGVEIQCLKSNTDYWDQILKSLIEIFKNKGIPIRFGATDYISMTTHSGSTEYCAFSINVSTIELDRLLEAESKLYQASGNRYSLYQTANPNGVDGFLPHEVIKAIDNTIFEHDGYPVAYIIKEKSNAFCLVCDANAKYEEHTANAFYDFYLLFEDLCKKNDIKKLTNSHEYAVSRKVPNSSIIKYEFNISPTDMEELLLLECPHFASYRGPASINRLVDPDSEDIKKGVICLFPALLLTDDAYMPRNAGCNMSEIISVQLAYYIKNYLLKDVDVPRKQFFDHHNSKLTENFLKIDSYEIFAALAKCINLASINHEDHEFSIRPLSMSNTPQIQIRDLDEDSRRIYQRHSVVTHVELEQLKSCEIYIDDFLGILTATITDRVNALLLREDALTNDTKKNIEYANESILQINTLRSAIKANSPRMGY